jgi:hypothetical protein
LVILAEENSWSFKDSCKIHCFVKIAFGGCSIAEICHGNDFVSPDFSRPGCSHGLRDMGSDRNGNRQQIDSLGRAASHLVSHPVEHEILKCNPHHQRGSQFSKGWEDPISLLKDIGTTNLTGLLSPEGRIRSKPPLTLKEQSPLVSQPDENHLLIKGQRFLIINGRLETRLERPIRFKDLKHLSLEWIIIFE